MDTRNRLLCRYKNGRASRKLSKLPFAFHHIVLSSDGHVGYGMPIGGVLATTNAIIPNAVGVDIGCGMIAVQTNLTEITKDELKSIMSEIRKQIPLGFEHHKHMQNDDLMPDVSHMIDWQELHNWDKLCNSITQQEYSNAKTQIGTLGGGNHFIEIQKGNDGHIWIMIHSGSRNIGKKVADHYNRLAVALNEKYYSSVPKEWELAFLPVNSEECHNYIREMQYCVDFAFANRKLMMDRIIDIFHTTIAGTEVSRINIAHNYVTQEHHFGRDVWVHRKGATLARLGTIGIIPGSQGTKSYIVEGLGNEISFMSCSHGAGRKMGRKEAERTLVLEDEIKKLDAQGIIHSVRGKQDLDEASGAYKDISVVMENQKELVKILVELLPLAVIKG